MSRRLFSKLLFLSAWSIFGACSSGVDLKATDLNKETEDYVLYTVNLFLNQSQCQDAYDLLYPIYHSSRSNWRIRTAMASVYGCSLGVSLQQLINEVAQKGSGSVQGIFSLAALLFPSTQHPIDDKKPLSAMHGMDAIFSTLRPGVFVYPGYSIHATSFNPGSLVHSDREDLSNTYLLLLSLGLMGTLENRYGLPDANGSKTQNLPWSSVQLLPGDGCAFVAGLMNFYDSISFLADKTQGGLFGSAYLELKNTFELGLNTACQLGCAACGTGLTCPVCPISMRDRSLCTGVNTDPNSCAGVALVQFVNSTW